VSRGAAGDGTAGNCARVVAAGSGTRSRSAHIEEAIKLVARWSGAGANIATGPISEIADVGSFATWATDVARPRDVSAARTSDVVAAGGGEFAEGLAAAGWSFE
jgi:hypothetical protein